MGFGQRSTHNAANLTVKRPWTQETYVRGEEVGDPCADPHLRHVGVRRLLVHVNGHIRGVNHSIRNCRNWLSRLEIDKTQIVCIGRARLQVGTALWSHVRVVVVVVNPSPMGDP